VYDLGTAGDPGLNVFQNPGAANTSAGVLVNAASVVSAVGNTWLADQQGANAEGKYVPASGEYTELVGPVTTGQNYRIQTAAQKLRL